ncbi:MAG: type II secretion system protein [Bacilli bacterium]
MKKLNRKGFTLIELLAVIVILAIVMVVTIPSVISSMNKAKEESLNNAAATVTEWFTKQYELAVLSSDIAGDVSDDYKTFVNELTDKKLPESAPTSDNLTPEVLKAAGITDTTGLKGKVYLNGTKICVNLTADNTSQFYSSRNGATNTATGSGC